MNSEEGRSFDKASMCMQRWYALRLKRPVESWGGLPLTAAIEMILYGRVLCPLERAVKRIHARTSKGEFAHEHPTSD